MWFMIAAVNLVGSIRQAWHRGVSQSGTLCPAQIKTAVHQPLPGPYGSVTVTVDLFGCTEQAEQEQVMVSPASGLKNEPEVKKGHHGHVLQPES